MRVFSLLCLGLLLLAVSSAPASAATLTPKEQLGKEIFFDKISSPDWMSCAKCHGPSVGFTGPNPAINAHGAVYNGAVPQRFGNRKPPSAAYATTAPNFHYDPTEGIFVGGNFWDGRATGDHLGNPAADQALGPFLNPVEQNNPSKRAVLEQIASSQYAGLWEPVWGSPLTYDTDADVAMNYDRVGLSIAAYEGSSEVNAFTSKYDYWLKGEASLTDKEQWGMALFEGKANCAACHPAPLFTDYTYDNLGTPINPFNPWYSMNEVYLDDGSVINPEGGSWIDPGLGGYLATLPESYFSAMGLVKAVVVAENWGKHKVPTLRNVDKRPSSEYTKAYLHNGTFTSLKRVIDFYNTRDIGKWPPPEVPQNVNTDELGNLGLTRAEVNAVLAFLGTLSDGYIPDRPFNTAAEFMGDATRPVQLSLRSGNPARAHDAGTRFELALARAGHVELALFDARGRMVRRICSEALGPGRHEYRWDGTTSRGELAPRGVYFAVLRSGDAKDVRRVIWLR